MDELADAKLYGRINAIEVMVVQLWAFVLFREGIPVEDGKAIGKDLIQAQERSRIHGALNADDAYSISQHMLVHLEHLWSEIEEKHRIQPERAERP